MSYEKQEYMSILHNIRKKQKPIKYEACMVQSRKIYSF